MAEPPSGPALRTAFGRFATGVTIVTCVDADGAPVGLTVNSFSSLSLDPPLLLWSLRRVSARTAAFQAASHFAINVLAQHQIELSRRFASTIDGKFDAGDWSAGVGDAPVLEGCVAVFECERLSQQDAGDHVLFIGRVERMRDSTRPPLVYQSGHYHCLGDLL